VSDSVDLPKANDGSAGASVVPKLPALLTAAITRAFETMDGHASSDGGLVRGIDRVIADENDVLDG
jgi:hypothetical protein